jgi:hypothetical protein
MIAFPLTTCARLIFAALLFTTQVFPEQAFAEPAVNNDPTHELEADIATRKRSRAISELSNGLRRHGVDLAVHVARTTGLQIDGSDETDRLLLEADVAAAVFDRFLYPGGFDDDAARCRLKLLLRQKISFINRMCELSESQKQSLQLAGHGDIERLFDRVYTERKRFILAVGEDSDGTSFETVLGATSSLRSPLNSGTFEHDSLFAKVLTTRLTPAQVAKYRRARSKLSPAHQKTVPDLPVAKCNAS